MATPPPATRERRGTLAGERVLDRDVERSRTGHDGHAQVAAAVDDEAARAGEHVGGGVRREPLRRPGGVEPQARAGA